MAAKRWRNTGNPAFVTAGTDKNARGLHPIDLKLVFHAHGLVLGAIQVRRFC
jgi:hypothetical protein